MTMMQSDDFRADWYGYVCNAAFNRQWVRLT